MPRFDVTAIGEGQLRFSVPAGTRLEQARQLDVYASGTEANVTCTLSRLGWQCGWVSALPETPLGRRVANEYRLAGLDLSAVKWSRKHRLATYYVEYAVPPRATQVYYDRADTCFNHLEVGDVPWDYLLGTRVLHLSGLTVALCKGTHALIRECLQRAKKRALKTSLDVNYRSRLWSPEEARTALTPLVKGLDILFCSRRDAKTVFGLEGDSATVIRQLHELSGAAFVVMSMSHEGILGFDGQTTYQEPIREVIILDRIGAGDAMVAGVLHGYLQGDFSKSLKYGALTAAMALSQHGDQPLTSRFELEQLTTSAEDDIVR